jgi:prephenate dehydratase
MHPLMAILIAANVLSPKMEDSPENTTRFVRLTYERFV